MEIQIPQFSANKYLCTFCNINCSKKNDWNRHILTAKHNRNIGNKQEINNYPKELICDCGKKYITNCGLWKHMKKCKIKDTLDEKKTSSDVSIVETNVSYLTNLVLEVVKNNSEMQKH